MHPCLECGACCATFRVAFYWREAEVQDTERAVPIGLFEELSSTQRCMKGTNKKHHPKCVALDGRIGEQACCSIYPNRPTPCRNFKASYEDGKPNGRCDDARTNHGLKPLRREDWL
jgi:uncharacterized protein